MSQYYITKYPKRAYDTLKPAPTEENTESFNKKK